MAIEHTDKIDVTDEDIRAIKQEADAYNETSEQMANRLFKENLPHAVIAISKLAMFASNEKIRLDASRYIVERNLGRLQDGNNLALEPLEKFLSDVEQIANAGSK